MDPKAETQAPGALGETAAAEPVTLGKLAVVRLTPQELAQRKKEAEEEEALKREQRRPKSGPNASTMATPLMTPTAPRAPAVSAPRPAVTVPGGGASGAGGMARPAPSAPQPQVVGESPGWTPTQAPILSRLLETTLTLLGAEGKHLAALSALATRVAKKTGVTGEELERVPCAVQALYVASQLDRRGPYTPPELATLQKLLGPSWDSLAPLLEPCAKGMMGKGQLTRLDTGAVAATIYFFNHARTAAPPQKVAKAALGTLRALRWLPADALDALTAEVAG